MYIKLGELELPGDPEINWYLNHVQESQYLLQVTKLKDTTCCISPKKKKFDKSYINIRAVRNLLIISYEGRGTLK